jgi:hypothetical protein
MPPRCDGNFAIAARAAASVLNCSAFSRGPKVRAPNAFPWESQHSPLAGVASVNLTRKDMPSRRCNLFFPSPRGRGFNAISLRRRDEVWERARSFSTRCHTKNAKKRDPSPPLRGIKDPCDTGAASPYFPWSLIFWPASLTFWPTLLAASFPLSTAFSVAFFAFSAP